MNLFRWLKNIFFQDPDIYQGIEDLPIYNWFKIQETGVYLFLVKSGHCNDMNVLSAQWEKIYNEFIDTFGVNNDFRSYLELKQEIELLNIDMAITGDRSIINFINQKKREMDDINAYKEKTNFNEGRVFVEKYMGFRLDEKITSVKDYYSYIYTIEKSNKAKTK